MHQKYSKPFDLISDTSSSTSIIGAASTDDSESGSACLLYNMPCHLLHTLLRCRGGRCTGAQQQSSIDYFINNKELVNYHNIEQKQKEKKKKLKKMMMIKMKKKIKISLEIIVVQY